MFKSILTKFFGKSIEPSKDQIPNQIVNCIGKQLNEKEQKVFDAFCKFYMKKESILNRMKYYYVYYTRPVEKIVGKFKFKFCSTIEAGIYDATDPKLYEKILTIKEEDDKIIVMYESGIWDDEFIETMLKVFEERIDQIKTERLIKQERIQKMFSKDLI